MRYLKKYRYLIYILAVLPLFMIRDFTPDNELRYLSIADEAIRNGNIFTFTNHGINYADKPPLYLWIVMLGKILFGHHSMLFLALFSYIPALVTIFIMGRWIKRFVSQEAAIAGELMLLTSVYFIGSGVVLRMDMLMCMFITLALDTFYRMYIGEGKKADGYLFPIFVFFSVFSKGPVGIMVPLISTITFLIFKRDYRAIGRFWGIRTISVLFALCTIWFLGVWIEGGNEYLNNLLFNQTINRAVNSFHHKEPFYYYGISIWYSLFPWSLLVVSMLIAGIFRRSRIKQDESSIIEQFFLIIALSTFLTLSLVSSKLQIYLLPAFPFFIYLTLLWLPKYGSTGTGPSGFVRISLELPALLFALAAPAYIVVKLFTDIPEIESLPSPTKWLIPLAALSASCFGVWALCILHSKNMQIYKTITLLGSGILMTLFLFSFTLSDFNSSLGMGELCKEAKEAALREGTNDYLFYKLRRAENIDIYLGTQPREVTLDELEQIVMNIRGNEKDPSILQPAHSILLVKQSNLVKDKDAGALFEAFEKHSVGSYYYIIL